MSGRITPAKTSGLSNKGSKLETLDSIPSNGCITYGVPENYQNGWWYYRVLKNLNKLAGDNSNRFFCFKD